MTGWSLSMLIRVEFMLAKCMLKVFSSASGHVYLAARFFSKEMASK
jgi:hypothetical protein